ncbi:MAG TPA: TerC/Alx family metal homeostasis membrane protein [Candidatus Methanomethylophilaceae archaeon]|nr:TerC/Alx family metal homeostasis membrane protein [Candidatus Methanomethylophilaceae archaeon]
MFADAHLYEWIAVFVLFAALLALDIGVINRKGKHITTKTALWQTAGWISIALVFGIYVWFTRGAQTGMEYYAAYVIEEALSVDNMFVFLLIFALFAIPDDYQHKALFYGVIGAIFFRFVFIFAGAELLDRFHFLMYIFGVFLIFAALKTMFGKDSGSSGKKISNWLSRHMNCSPELDGDKFFTIRGGVRMATPLLVCVIVIELTDIVFALDSIPAVLSITTDKFVLFTSNIFAVLGLRSLYFALRGTLTHLRYLKYGLGTILLFVGAKMIIGDIYEFEIMYSLVLILGILAVTVIASIIAGHRDAGQEGST